MPPWSSPTPRLRLVGSPAVLELPLDPSPERQPFIMWHFHCTRNAHGRTGIVSSMMDLSPRWQPIQIYDLWKRSFPRPLTKVARQIAIPNGWKTVLALASTTTDDKLVITIGLKVATVVTARESHFWGGPLNRLFYDTWWQLPRRREIWTT